MRVIGLTGAVGSGKSTFAYLLGDLGARVIDVDALGHEALRVETVKTELRLRFGADIFDANGEVIRSALAVKAFADEETLARLTEVVYPVIGEMIGARLDEFDDGAPVVLDAATLFEADWDALADVVVTVEADAAARQRRLRTSRDWSDDELARREMLKLPEEERRRRADAAIDNNDTLDALRMTARTFWVSQTNERR